MDYYPRIEAERLDLADFLDTLTDADWSAGAGSTELRGPVQDLLLVATGREARAGQIIK